MAHPNMSKAKVQKYIFQGVIGFEALILGTGLGGVFNGINLQVIPSSIVARFLSSPFTIRVPFFQILSFNKETPN